MPYLFSWNSKADILALVSFPILATVLSVLYDLNLVMSTLLFFGIPSLYLSLKKPDHVKRTFLFSLLPLPFFLVFDYIAYVDLTWYVPNSLLRFLQNTTTIEEILWIFLWMYFAIMFWEYFLDRSKAKEKFSKFLKYFIILISVLVTGLFLAYVLKKEILVQPYFYLKLGLIFVLIPLVAFLMKFPRLLRKILLIGAYFSFVSLLFEYVGLRNGHWYFPGEHYLGVMNFFGNVLPYDELIFWIVLGVPSVIVWYEFFADDRR